MENSDKIRKNTVIELADGRALGFNEYGQPDGVPIFSFHGTPGSRVLSLDGEPVVEKYGIRVIAPDRPGYGLSDPQSGRSFADWVTDVETLANHLDLDQFHVAGGSGGGPYALACAIHLPARILSATLTGSGVPPEQLQQSKGMANGNKFAFFVAKYIPVLLKIALANYAKNVNKHPEKLVEKMLTQLCEWDQKIITDKIGIVNTSDLILHLQEAFRTGIDGAYSDMRLISRSWQLDLNQLAVPVFLWHGEADTLMPIEPARSFAKVIPGCEAHFIPGAGHLLLESEEIGIRIVEKILSVQP